MRRTRTDIEAPRATLARGDQIRRERDERARELVVRREQHNKRQARQEAYRWSLLGPVVQRLFARVATPEPRAR